MDKTSLVINQSGVPKFLIIIALQLFEQITATGGNKELVRNMKQVNAQSFNKLKSRFNKFLKSDAFNLMDAMEQWKAVCL